MADDKVYKYCQCYECKHLKDCVAEIDEIIRQRDDFNERYEFQYTERMRCMDERDALQADRKRLDHFEKMLVDGWTLNTYYKRVTGQLSGIELVHSDGYDDMNYESITFRQAIDAAMKEDSDDS